MPYKIISRKGRTSGYVDRITAKEYVLTYPVGKIVEMLDNTVGIFCFNTKRDAMGYKSSSHGDRMVVQVKGIEEMEMPESIPFGNNIGEWYARQEDVLIQCPPRGSVLYRAIVAME